MSGEKDIRTYCDYVFEELMDIKEKISKMEENAEDLSAEDKRTVSDNVLTYLDELSSQIDSKLQSITAYCPGMKERIKGASKWVSEFHVSGSRS